MVAQQYQFQIQATGKKIDPAELERLTNGKKLALAKREENKRTGQKPRELKLPPVPHHHAEVYVDRELRQPMIENTLGKKIVDTIIAVTSEVASPKAIKAMATKGRDDKGHFVPKTKKAAAKEAYELIRLTRLAD